MAGLRSLDVELEAVTPLWIGGADARAELRPPSVRGCMRFWFRALAGGVMGEALKDVRACGIGGLREYGGAPHPWWSACSDRRESVFRLRIEIDQLPGLSYMYWSVFQQTARRHLAGRAVPAAPELASLPLRRGGGGGADAGDGGQLRAGGGLPLAVAAAGRGWRPWPSLRRGNAARSASRKAGQRPCPPWSAAPRPRPSWPRN